jgi:hypothetical protein
MELHHSARSCRPLPGLLGQRDSQMENGECKVQNAVRPAENNCVDDDGPYGRESGPAAVPTILATVVRTFSG